MDLVLGILGSGALAALISGVFQLINNRKGWRGKIEQRLDAIDEKQANQEKDEIRTQLLVMLSDFPDEQQEILKLAQHYFTDLDGNWYMTSMFNKWLETNKIAKPEWFKGG